MHLALGADHAGFAYKQAIYTWLTDHHHTVADFGTYSPDSVDYADFAHPVATAVEEGRAALGILICGSGEGVCMTANKHQGIRAALVWQPDLAAVTRQHNNANVLCLPARFIDLDTALECVEVFIKTDFEGGRHQRRIDKMSCGYSSQ